MEALVQTARKLSYSGGTVLGRDEQTEKQSVVGDHSSPECVLYHIYNLCFTTFLKRFKDDVIEQLPYTEKKYILKMLALNHCWINPLGSSGALMC